MSVLFVGTSELPDQSANATRIVNLAKIFNKCGEKSFLIGTRYNDTVPLSGVYDGLEYIHVDAANYMNIPRYKRTGYVEKLLDSAIRECWEKQHYHLIIISGFAYQSIKFIMDFAKEKRITIAVNSVEWYEKNNETFDGLSGKIKFIKNRYGMIVQHKRAGNVIGISSLLSNYYKERGCNTVRIPTIVDKNKYIFAPETSNEKLIISYAGSPARKDYITNAITALSLLKDSELKKIELHIYGAAIEQIKCLGIGDKMISSLEGTLYIHGRIPYSEVQDKISHSDFTILLRPDMRYANAGFPTKVGESMMCGTPVIANITSDLGMYIRNNETGIVVKNESPEACADGFRKAIDMTEDEKRKMRANARNEAEKSFDFEAYTVQMNQFIKGLKQL